MAYKIVGVDENSDFPARVESRLVTKFTVPDASETVKGKVELASATETTAGTDTTRAVTPAGVKAVADTKANSSHTHSAVDITGIDAKVDSRARQTALAVKRGGFYEMGALTPLRDAIANPNNRMRVVMLGESHVVGGHTKWAGQGFVNRLAARARSAPVVNLTDVNAAVTGAGMKWYNGGINASGTATYYPSSHRTSLNYVNPDYVIHHIGVNDFSQQFSISDVKNNLRSVLSQIEADNPGAINILIHSFGLPYPQMAVTIPWSLYGIAMKEVADENQSMRIYIDVNDPMSLLGMDTGNSGGLLNADKVHLNEIGAKFYADIIGAELGIPSERDYATEQVFDFPQVPANSVAIDSTRSLSSLTIPAVSYPRNIHVRGVVYAPTPGHAANIIEVRPMSGIQGGNVRQTAGSTDQGKYPISAQLFLPAGVTGVVELWAIILGGTMLLNDETQYDHVRAVLTPA